MKRNKFRILTAFLLVPVGVFFLSCCCLKADAAVQKKSSCSSCSKKEDSQKSSPDECPHSKIKAVSDNHHLDLQLTKSLASIVVLNFKEFISPGAELFILPQLTAPPLHPSLYFQNPILRV